MEIIYDERCPKVLTDILNPLFEKFLFIIPSWVEDIYVTFDDDQSEDYALAETSTVFEYRRIELKFYPDFICERIDQMYYFVHELCHAVYGALHQYCHTTVCELLPDFGDTAHKNHLLNQMRVYNEGATQDLTNMIFRMLNIDKRTGKRLKK